MKKVKYLLFMLMLVSCSQNTSTSYNSSSPSIENTISTSSNLISSTDDVSSSFSSVSSSSSSTSLNLSTTTKDSTSSSSEKESSNSTIVDNTSTSTSSSVLDSSSSSSQVSNSPIKSLTAVSEVVELKIGETHSIANYYELIGHKSLTAKQKKVVVTSSNETVLTISSNYKAMTAINIGTSIITVTSTVDETKFCTFTVNVTDSFFDREIASMSPSWDLTHENDEINPYIKIDTDLSSGIFAKEIDDTKWFIETEITIHSFLNNEQNSKVGIVTNTFNNTDLPNKIFYYLNTPMSNENEWNTFGITELKSIEDLSTSIGSRAVITKENENVYLHDELITYDKTFKMGMLRDNLNFYLYVNGKYVYTFEATSELFDLTPSKVGFFSFSTEITFSNYYIIKDEVKLNEMIESI